MAVSNKIPVERVDEVLNIVGLTSVAKKNAGGFSLGDGIGELAFAAGVTLHELSRSATAATTRRSA